MPMLSKVRAIALFCTAWCNLNEETSTQSSVIFGQNHLLKLIRSSQNTP